VVTSASCGFEPGGRRFEPVRARQILQLEQSVRSPIKLRHMPRGTVAIAALTRASCALHEDVAGTEHLRLGLKT
jgi:hypothetical protein